MSMVDTPTPNPATFHAPKLVLHAFRWPQSCRLLSGSVLRARCHAPHGTCLPHAWLQAAGRDQQQHRHALPNKANHRDKHKCGCVCMRINRGVGLHVGMCKCVRPTECPHTSLQQPSQRFALPTLSRQEFAMPCAMPATAWGTVVCPCVVP